MILTFVCGLNKYNEKRKKRKFYLVAVLSLLEMSSFLDSKPGLRNNGLEPLTFHKRNVHVVEYVSNS